MNKLDIENLSYGNIRQTSKELPDEGAYGIPSYEIIYPTVTEDNRKALIEEHGLDASAEDWEINDSIIASGAYDPAVDWCIPFWDEERTNEEIANILEGSGLVLVTFDEDLLDGCDKGLCLTGCGSVFTWDIVQAFILLGFYPPVDFCHLPKIAGQANRGEVEACNASLKVAADRLMRQIESNNTLTD